MRVALVLVFVALARSAQAGESKRNPADYLRYDIERETVEKILGSPENDDAPPETTPEPEAANRLMQKFAILSGGRDLETANCSFGLEYKILETLRDEPKDSDDVRTFKSLARSKLEGCAREFDRKFKNSDEYMFEWSLDKFFEKGVATDQKITDKALFETAASFDFGPEMFQNEGLCRVAAAYNKLMDDGTPGSLRPVIRGRASISWYLRLRLNGMLAKALKDVETANCGPTVYGFFTHTCGSSYPDLEFDLRHVDYAALLGADLHGILSARTAKYREYRRLCYSQENYQPTRGGL